MNDILGIVKTAGIKAIGKVKKASPEILLGLGTVSIVTGIIFAVKNSKKAEEAIESFHEVRDVITSTEIGTTVTDENGKEIVYSEKDKKEDLTNLYKNTIKDVAKAYVLPAGLVVGGFSMIFSGYGILKHRNTQAVAAATAIAQAFKDYKEKVKEALGIEKEQEIRYNAVEIEKEEEVEKDGKKKKVKKKIRTFSDLANDPYAKCFDETNVNWKNDNAHNKTFLLQAQNWANDLYNARGHVFLNEVYDLLGFDHTSTGAVAGWVKGKGDDYISFGIEDGVMEANRAFVRGEEPSIWLDFNVDGVILDYI